MHYAIELIIQVKMGHFRGSRFRVHYQRSVQKLDEVAYQNSCRAFLLRQSLRITTFK